MPSIVQQAKGRLGAAARLGGDVTGARRDLAAAKIEQYITEVVASAPPLTQEQRDRLAALLRPTGTAQVRDAA